MTQAPDIIEFSATMGGGSAVKATKSAPEHIKLTLIVSINDNTLRLLRYMGRDFDVAMEVTNYQASFLDMTGQVDSAAVIEQPENPDVPNKVDQTYDMVTTPQLHDKLRLIRDDGTLPVDSDYWTNEEARHVIEYIDTLLINAANDTNVLELPPVPESFRVWYFDSLVSHEALPPAAEHQNGHAESDLTAYQPQDGVCAMCDRPGHDVADCPDRTIVQAFTVDQSGSERELVEAAPKRSHHKKA